MHQFDLKSVFKAVTIVAIAAWMFGAFKPFGIVYALMLIAAFGAAPIAKYINREIE